jgi:signal recognition particle subunit SRP54
MGPLTQLMGMIPGFSQALKDVPEDLTEKQMKRVEAIISSMTRDERHKPDMLNARRRQRIANGSGTSVQEVNDLIKQFKQMQRLMHQFGKGKGRGGLRIPGFPGLG